MTTIRWPNRSMRKESDDTFSARTVTKKYQKLLSIDTKGSTAIHGPNSGLKGRQILSLIVQTKMGAARISMPLPHTVTPKVTCPPLYIAKINHNNS